MSESAQEQTQVEQMAVEESTPAAPAAPAAADQTPAEPAAATVDGNVGHLEEEALKRKERLAALRKGNLKTLGNRATTKNEEGDENEEDESKLPFPKPLFRNYKPSDESLQKNQLPKPTLIEIENEIKDQLENGQAKPLIEKEIDLTTLAPQKIDWDLKREAEKRLKLLERRTQKAIVELIRNRLKGEKNSDLAELVSVAARDNIKRNEDHKKENKDDSDDEDDDDDDDEEEETNVQVPEYASKDQDESPVLDSKDDEEKFVNTKTEISDDDDY